MGYFIIIFLILTVGSFIFDNWVVLAIIAAVCLLIYFLIIKPMLDAEEERLREQQKLQEQAKLAQQAYERALEKQRWEAAEAERKKKQEAALARDSVEACKWQREYFAPQQTMLIPIANWIKMQIALSGAKNKHELYMVNGARPYFSLDGLTLYLNDPMLKTDWSVTSWSQAQRLGFMIACIELAISRMDPKPLCILSGFDSYGVDENNPTLKVTFNVVSL